MAKKIVVDDIDTSSKQAVPPENVGKKKKNKHKCLTCCGVFVGVLLVLAVAIFATGWLIGDKYSQQYFEMPIQDTLGVVNSLYWAKEKDCVDRPYSDGDRNKLYTELKDNVFLKKDTDIDFDGMILEAIDEFLPSKDAGGSVPLNSKKSRAPIKNEDGDSTSQGFDSTSQSEILDKLIDLLSEKFISSNIDKLKLGAYTPEADDYIFNLEDTSLGDLVNLAVKAAVGKLGNIDGFETIAEYLPNLKNQVVLKQIKYEMQPLLDEAGNAVKDESGKDEKVVACNLVLWVGVQDAAGDALTKLLNDVNFGWASGAARWLGNVLLPKNLYLSVSVPLQDGAKASVGFNNVAKNRENTYKLANGVMKNIVGSDMTVDSLLNGVVDYIKPILDKISGYLDFSNAEEKHTLDFDLLNFATTFLNDGKDEAECISKPEIIYMLQALLTTTSLDRMKALEPYLYKNWYCDADGKNPIYKYDGVDVTGKTRIKYDDKFIQVLEDAYCLDFNGKPADEALAMLGISFDDSSSGIDVNSILDIADKVKFADSLKAKTVKKLQVTDRMLAAIISIELDKMLEAGAIDLQGATVDLEALSFVTDTKYPEHTFALMAVKIGISGIFDSMGDNKIIGLIKGLLPSDIMVSMQVDITLNETPGFRYADTIYTLNDYDKTGVVLNTLKKLVPSFDVDQISKQLTDNLRPMIKDLDKTVNIEFVNTDLSPVQTLQNQDLVLPDVYTVIVKTKLSDDNGVGIVTGEELRQALYHLNDTTTLDAAYPTPQVNGSLTGFLSDVTSKYYLNPPSPLTTFDDLTSFLTVDPNNEAAFAEKFNVEASATYPYESTKHYVAYDTRSITDLKPLLTGGDLGAVINEKISSNADLDMMQLYDVEITSTSIIITMKADFARLMPSEVKKLLSAQNMYMKVTVDVQNEILIGGDKAYKVDIAINDMNSDTQDNLIKIVNTLAPGINITAKADEFGKTIYNAFSEIKDSVGEGLYKFTNGGIQFASFYEFLAKKLNVDKNDGTHDSMTDDEWANLIRNTVQGLYVKIPDVTDNYNNYSLSDFLVNAPSGAESGSPDHTTTSPVTIKYYDKNFNSFFQDAINNDAHATDVTALQTIALSNGAVNRGATRMRTWAQDHTGNDLTGKDIIFLTMEMSVAAFADGDATPIASKFLPEKFYVSAALEIGTNNKISNTYLAFNEMNKDEYDLMVRLMGLSTGEPSQSSGDTVSIQTIIAACVNEVNTKLASPPYSYGALSLEAVDQATEDGGHGMGMITFVSP